MAKEPHSTSSSAPLRWGKGERVDDRKQGAARVLAAARSCYEELGIASTTMDAIAERAGVSRRTVYRYFENKDAVLLAVVEEQAEPFLHDLQQSLAQLPGGDFRQLLIHCVLYSIENGPHVKGHELLLAGDNAAATERFYLRSTRMKRSFVGSLEAPFRQAQLEGQIDASWQLDDLVNWVGRLVYSFVRNPESPDSMRRIVAQFLLPQPTSSK